MAESAILVNTNTNQFQVAKQFNNYKIDAGGTSEIFFIEEAEFKYYTRNGINL